MLKSAVALLAPDPVRALQAEIDQAQAVHDAAEYEVGAALIDAATNPGPSADQRCQRANKAFDDTGRHLASLQARLAATQKTGASRTAIEAAKAAARALAARWATGRAAGDDRVAAVKDIERLGVALGKAWRRAEEATMAMRQTGLAYDADGALLSPGPLQNVLRHGLVKAALAGYDDQGSQAGPFYPFHWAAGSTPKYLVEQLPALTERVQAANDHFMAQKVSR